MQEQMNQMNHNLELLTEQMAIANQKRFGRSSEKFDLDGQLSLNGCFNEAEVTADSGASTAEPELEEICPHSYKRHKKKGKREEDLKGIEAKEISHELSDEQLTTLFGKMVGNVFLM